jgi:DNA topoisomerase-1
LQLGCHVLDRAENDLSNSSIVNAKHAAQTAGLRYVCDSQPGIRRKKAGKGFIYLQPDGSKVVDKDVHKRIRSIVIPPAWQQVWICRFAHGHVQATGRDARGRKQYRYHSAFREIRESSKFEHMMMFARMLPIIRVTVREHMGLRGLPREKVLATVVHLLETTLIRVGNDDYAKHNESYGLTTLRNRHVAIEGSQLRFQFTGKGGKKWSVAIRDRRVAKIIRACQELPGQELLQYVDETGERRDVTSTDVNEYLHETTGENVTAKDFRTWGGTVLAALALRELEEFDSAAKAKKNIRAAIERVASRLGNTPTICRKCYIHPQVLTSYVEGSLLQEMKTEAERELRDELDGLSPQEAAVLASLRTRLESKTKTSNPQSKALSRSSSLPMRDKRQGTRNP